MNDMMSSRQHEPNQVTEFSQQYSTQHAYHETAYHNISAAIASPNVTHTQEVVPIDFSNQQKITKIFRKSVPVAPLIAFDGNPEQWLDLIGLFNATTYSTDISHLEKMTHLQLLVSGDAKSLIRGYGFYGLIYNKRLNAIMENDFGNPTKKVTSFFR